MNPSTVYCDTCGAANRPTARFCTACGHTMPAASSLPPTVLAGSAVSSPPTPPTVQATPPPTSPSLTGRLPANSFLKGRYLILSRLGQGGMGAVYQASDTQLGDRPVAVKEMSQKGLDPQELTEATTSFKHEALLLAGLFQHNLPRIYDHFEESSRWYLVMDFIAGQTLEEYLAKAGGTLPVQEVLDIGIQLCTVLSYLHTHQPPIIFRDLKPSNVMRTDDGHLYLIDFGIARHFKPGQAKDTVAYGSAGYAAPEQFGKAQTTPQSDIYSLGATLHHLLSGNDPSANRPTFFDFPPLHLPGLPAGLGTLIMHMVEKEPNKRPASMAEVKQQLQQLAAQPQGSQLPPTVYVGGSSLPPTQLAIPTPPPAVPVQSVPPSPPQPMKASPPLGTVLCTYRRHYSRVQGLAWSPEGKRIASASDDRTVQVWEAADGGNVYTYRGHSDHVYAVAWSPEGTRIVSGSRDATVQVWEAGSGTNLLTYRGHASEVWTLAWSPEGTRIASGSGDKKVQVWEASSGTNLLTCHGHSDGVYAVAWSPEGTRIASGSGDKKVQMWEAATGKNLLTYRGHSSFIYAVAWSPDGTRIASGGNDGAIRVWEASTGKNLYAWTFAKRGYSLSALAVAWSPDGTRIVLGSNAQIGGVKVWDAADGGNPFYYTGHSDVVRAVVWSPDGKCIASGSDDGMVQVWQAV
jgi:WD40 repeat protein/tRNA A-37 threonylcarbamoyl transferase component Bud32